jgi:uncharacterized protein (TIGR00730 family)
MHSVCVYCGSKVGKHPEYRRAAQQLGELLAARELQLVYGGGQVGLMGVIADAVLAAGGTVVGVIPDKLATKELLHPGVQEMHVVRTMHERKAKMTQLADAFIAMPGGYGTFDELFEAITWAQIGYHNKPIGLLNTAGYFDPLLQLIGHAIDEQFIAPRHAELVMHDATPEALLDQLAAACK